MRIKKTEKLVENLKSMDVDFEKENFWQTKTGN